MFLKEIRKQKELTQSELSELAGVKRQTISMIEIGQRRPTPEVAMRIAVALGFDWTRFYTEEFKAERRGEGEQSPETAKA
jgi:transcriptional regulator with XRE-family HTH domain